MVAFPSFPSGSSLLMPESSRLIRPVPPPLQVYGFSHKLPLLTRKIFNTLQGLEVKLAVADQSPGMKGSP